VPYAFACRNISYKSYGSYRLKKYSQGRCVGTKETHTNGKCTAIICVEELTFFDKDKISEHKFSESTGIKTRFTSEFQCFNHESRRKILR
jgi:hypothetical protein